MSDWVSAWSDSGSSLPVMRRMGGRPTEVEIQVLPTAICRSFMRSTLTGASMPSGVERCCLVLIPLMRGQTRPIRRIGQPGFVGDLIGSEQGKEGLVEACIPDELPFLHEVMKFFDALCSQLEFADGRAVQKHFGGDDSAFPVFLWQKTLRNDAFEAKRKIHGGLSPEIFWVAAEDTLQGLRRVDGVEGGEDPRPVSAAEMATAMVSRSRISPMRMTSGLWRKTYRSPARKLSVSLPTCAG